MPTRRSFLRSVGIGGFALGSGSSLCVPPTTAIGGVSIESSEQGRQFRERLLGYPINMNTPPGEFFTWRERLFRRGIGEFAFNNVGDPFRDGPIAYNTHDYEREVIDSCAEQYLFPGNDTWGFLTNSGTDSNLHGMYMGRTLLQERTGATPRAYYTREAHYSIQILSDLLGLETVFVNTLPDGGMDSDDLAERVAETPDRPALIVATVGTTFKGAVDDVSRIRTRLSGSESWLHLDAALFGGYLPYTPFTGEVTWQSNDHGPHGRYDSIAVSCHKFYGFPSPAGLFITRRTLFEEFRTLFTRVHNPEYIRQVPGTITCSRDAVKPAEFVFFTTKHARTQQAEDTASMLDHTQYLTEQMRTHFPELSPMRASPMSNTIWFRSPRPAVIRKYSLATMRLRTPSDSSSYSHTVIMPHVTRRVLTDFLTDLETGRA